MRLMAQGLKLVGRSGNAVVVVVAWCMLLYAVVAKVRHLQLVWVPTLCCVRWVQASAPGRMQLRSHRSLQCMQVVHVGSAAHQLVNHHTNSAVFSTVFALTIRAICDSKHFILTYAASSVQHVLFGQSGQLLRQSRHCIRPIIGVTWLFT
jgi:hypothetical protein